MSKRWTKEETEKAKQMFSVGESWEEIENEIGKPKDSIRKKLNGLGYKKEKVPYLYKIGEVVNVTLKIVKQIRVSNGKNKTQKGYLVQSLVYPNAPAYETSEVCLKSGQGCAYKRGLRICAENSLWSKIDIRPNLINIKQAKTIAPHHDKPILFKCKYNDCNNTKMIKPSNIIKNGFSCNLCSKNIPYGQLAFGQYSEHFKLGYESEKVLETLDGRRVDFVKFDDKENIINFVEIQGTQHTDPSHKWYPKSHAQDIAKRKWAKATNTLMIEIDMRISSWEYFKEQINKCEYLPNINENDEAEILKLMENNKRYPVKEIIELYTEHFETTYQIGKRFKVDNRTIARILDKNNIPLRSSGAQVGHAPPNKLYLPDDEIIKMYTTEGLSVVYIADKYNVSKTPIYRILNENDIINS